MALYDTSIRRPVATTMSFLVVIVVGAVSFYYLPVDLLPEIEYPQVSVTTSYPNVGPEEMEQIITDPVANAVSSVSNVERITSQSSEGSSRVNMEFGQGTDLNADSRGRYDQRAGRDLPASSGQPQSGAAHELRPVGRAGAAVHLLVQRGASRGQREGGPEEPLRPYTGGVRVAG